MRMKLNEDYYFWCCDWCDSENRVLWARMQEGIYCGACHKPLTMPDTSGTIIEGNIAAGLY